MVSNHLNSGGFHMLGTGRDKIDTPQKMKQCRETCAASICPAVVVGGDDSNTNAAFLAENLRGINTQVIGIPKTIDGDLQAPGLLPDTLRVSLRLHGLRHGGGQSQFRL